jgi:hypothetical protein
LINEIVTSIEPSLNIDVEYIKKVLEFDYDEAMLKDRPSLTCNSPFKVGIKEIEECEKSATIKDIENENELNEYKRKMIQKTSKYTPHTDLRTVVSKMRINVKNRIYLIAHYNSADLSMIKD